MSERACGVRLHPAARLLRWMGRHAVGVCFLLIGVWLFRAVLAGADGIMKKLRTFSGRLRGRKTWKIYVTDQRVNCNRSIYTFR